VLVDGGAAFEGGFDVGERVVTPFLLSRGVRRLDLLVLTQPVAGRLGGLAAVARAVPIGEVWTPPAFPQVRGDLGLALAAARVPIVVRRPDDPPRRFGEVELASLPGAERVALRVAYRDLAIVFPPDGRAAPPPSAWAAPGAALPGPAATILHWPRGLLPLYGVAPLLDAVRPRLVVLAGEPGRRAVRELPELLDLIERRGARALVPERDGAIVVTTDGRGLEVRTVDRPDPLEEGM
jgi:competence protein ComEC